MTKDTIIQLVKREQVGMSVSGTPMYTETMKRCFAETDGVKRSEFYQAAAVGYRPEVIFRIHERVYNGARYLEHRGTKYRIIRSYPLSGERVELVCTSELNAGESEGTDG